VAAVSDFDRREGRAMRLRKAEPKTEARLNFEHHARIVMRKAVEEMRAYGHDVSAGGFWLNGECHTIIVTKEGA